ncbi:CAP domain-containing protein [Nostoc sp. MG11]|uniref:CAP domain-containing protein n=1 Tax=Nostoc sp. MG11 TaxID=2721166 RepID=UPI0018673AA3|nr:CAP domain-containing protein [Nostoc sp. MG11]
MIRTTIYGIVGTLVLSSGAIAISVPNQTSALKSSNVSSHHPQIIAQSSINTTAIEKAVFQQINNYRGSKNLPVLLRNSASDTQARIHSQNMANGRVSFGHSGFRQRVQAIAIPYISAGENVAYNQGYNDPAKQAVQGWLQSQGHLANIKGNYNLTGIGVATGPNGRIYLTQIFLRV